MVQPITNINPLDARNENVGVDAVNTSIAPVRQTRSRFILTNASTGGQIISLALGPTPAVATQGIVLNAGDKYGEADSEGFMCFRGQIQAISSAPAGVLAVYEVG